MLHRLVKSKRILLGGLTGLALLAITACTGSFGGSAISGALSDIIDAARSNTVFIRVGNSTGWDVEVVLRVDGVLKTLPACQATEGICDYVLTSCPLTIELLQERRMDSRGIFRGGSDFEGDPDFTFTSDEFECGSLILFEFSETTASASVF